MAKDNRIIASAVRVGGTSYGPGMEDELSSVATVAQLARLASLGSILGNWAPQSEAAPEPDGPSAASLELQAENDRLKGEAQEAKAANQALTRERDELKKHLSSTKSQLTRLQNLAKAKGTVPEHSDAAADVPDDSHADGTDAAHEAEADTQS